MYDNEFAFHDRYLRITRLASGLMAEVSADPAFPADALTIYISDSPNPYSLALLLAAELDVSTAADSPELDALASHI